MSLAGATGIGIASAATSTTSGSTSLIQKIAAKFNLKEADVKAVFDEDRTAHEADRTEAEKTRLDKAVTDGAITQAQEDLIIAKQAEMHTFMDSLKDKTETERRDAVKTKMDELKQWATDNNIPAQYLHMGPGRHHGPGRPGGDMAQPTVDNAN